MIVRDNSHIQGDVQMDVCGEPRRELHPSGELHGY